MERNVCVEDTETGERFALKLEWDRVIDFNTITHMTKVKSNKEVSKE